MSPNFKNALSKIIKLDNPTDDKLYGIDTCILGYWEWPDGQAGRTLEDFKNYIVNICKIPTIYVGYLNLLHLR